MGILALTADERVADVKITKDSLSVCPTSGFMPPYDSGTRHPFLLAQAG